MTKSLKVNSAEMIGWNNKANSLKYEKQSVVTVAQAF